MKPICQ